MKKLYILFLVVFYNSMGTAQTGIKVVFETQNEIKEESLKGIPAYLRATALQQVRSMKKESVMFLQDGKVYFEIKQAEIEKIKSGIIATYEKEGKEVLVNEVSAIAKIKAEKLIKNPKNNTYLEFSATGTKTKQLPVVKWQLTNKTKKILGYTCYEATTQFNKRLLTVYFTKDFLVKGSPSILPFINGVVLAYNYGIITATAVKLELKQPLITKFF